MSKHDNAPASVDWELIKQRWRTGESARGIAGNMPDGQKASKTAIVERAKHEGWKKIDVPDPLARALIAGMDIQDALENPASEAATRLGRFGLRTAENAANILELRRKGISLNGCAKAVGFSWTGLKKWIDEDPRFELLMGLVDAEFEERYTEPIRAAAIRGDYRAALDLLRTNAATKENYGGTGHGVGAGPSIQVTLNIPPPKEPPVIPSSQD